ncbi:MAG: cobalt-precorrin-6A reductase [Mycobacterium sp.]|nr:cobalt-precorrin-6A reductase [Mycobacterium sp.]
MTRVLLLGGTAEARALAGRLHPRIDVISSLAGRVPDPAVPVGPLRMGGFGGVSGLREWLVEKGITAVVDATHPFAAGITANAAAACAELRIPHVILHRPPWDPAGTLDVESDRVAADAVAAQGYSRVFLTTGRSGVAAFRASSAWLLIRVVTAPDSADLPHRHELVFSRGPYRYPDERALMLRHGIQVLVTKNSGGAMTAAKIQAAADLGIDIVMIRRPALPSGVRVVGTVDDAQNWVLSRGTAEV